MRTLAALLSAMTAAIVVSVAVAATSLDPKTLVLQRSDVPAGLKVAYAAAHPESGADVQPAPGSRAWLVAYARLTQSPLVIASSAYVFSSASAAHSGFSTMAAGFSKRGAKLYGSAFGPHSVSGLGAEQRAWTWPCDGTSCPKGSTEAFVFARPGRVAWGVNVMSAGGRSTVFSTTLGYARKQKARVGGG